ncbi:BnaA02g13480D [Brassica napus]|uniref:BnaA02g13480D protein n=1 Tax=Brassica napus TaxID=3708 RepID=A0A078FE82_BRANA|nr:BnaA02g13480D [Brassica napus]
MSVSYPISENHNPKDIETGGIKCVFTGEKQTRFLGYLRSLNTNILLAQPENLPHPVDEVSRPLLCNVSEVWIWKSLATGEKPIYRSGSLQDVGDASACSGSSQGVGHVKRVRLIKGHNDGNR